MTTLRRPHCTLVLLLAVALAVEAAPLPRSTPEAEGVRSAGIEGFLKALDETDAVHGFMIVRHGKVVSEGWWHPYKPAYRHKLYSLSKSFTSTAIGMAVAEGKLSIDDPVVSFFPNRVPDDADRNLRSMRVRDLLSMSTGHVAADLKSFSFATEGSLVEAFFDLPVQHKPGTHFLYNTPATYMCSAIVGKVSGESTLDYLRSRLFEPLGIEGPTWESDAAGTSLGGFGLSVRTEDIAMLGQLYLQGGEWEGRRLLPQAWVDAATARQTSNGSAPDSDWEQGYGFQFWRCRHGAYRGDGAFGQFCIVLPQEDTVIAMTSGTSNMPGLLNLVWEHLLPAMAPVALPEDPENREKLQARSRNLALARPEGEPGEDKVRGQQQRRYVFSANEQGVEAFEIRPMKGGPSLLFTVKGEVGRLSYGYKQRWVKGETGLGPALLARGLQKPEPIATVGAWPDNQTLVIKVCFTRTPYVLTLTARFDDDTLELQGKWNVAFGPRTFTLRGKRIDP